MKALALAGVVVSCSLLLVCAYVFVAKRPRKILRLGVIGRSGKTVVNESGARKAFTEVLDELMHKGYSQIEVVSGLTALGVPKLAYEEAQAKGLRTVGIACSEAKKFPCFPCNDIIIVGKRWGDESETFLQCIDMLVLIGEGGAQSWQEFNVFKGPKRRVFCNGE